MGGITGLQHFAIKDRRTIYESHNYKYNQCSNERDQFLKVSFIHKYKVFRYVVANLVKTSV